MSYKPLLIKDNKVVFYDNKIAFYDLKFKPGEYPTNGLLARWMFNGDLTDSYNSFDLTYVDLGSASPSYTTGHVSAQAISFNMDGGAYQSDASIVGTFTTWKPSTTAWWQKVLLPYGDWANISFEISRSYDSDQDMRCNNGTTGGGTGTISRKWYSLITHALPSTWNHYVLRVSTGSICDVFINNILVGTIPYATISSPTRLGWGYRVEASGSKFKGYINAAYVYNRAISDDEVAQLYNNGNGV